ncbi:MAG: ribosomal L7Ae/L30e/S12e/Gadd45 family protein [Bacillota bacterium]|nr:ribosomal L7Ae/L30e/S12e/Gadd45 family protein [Bacillota bacterium]
MSRLPVRWREILGLAMAAGKVAWGRRAARQALHDGVAELVVVAEDAGPSAAEEVGREAARRGVTCVRAGRQAELGAAIGRSPVGVLAVVDRGLAGKLMNEWKETSEAAGRARREVRAIAARDPSLRVGARAAHPFEGDPGLPSQHDEHRHQQPHEHDQRPRGRADPS